MFRSFAGYQLAFELELALRKWAGYGLDPVLLQKLVRECYDRLRNLEAVEDGS